MRGPAFETRANAFFEWRSQQRLLHYPVARVDGSFVADGDQRVFFAALVTRRLNDPRHPKFAVISAPDTDSPSDVKLHKFDVIGDTLYEPEYGMLVASNVPILTHPDREPVNESILLCLKPAAIPSRIGNWALECAVNIIDLQGLDTGK